MAVTRVEPGCIGCSLSTEMDSRVVLHYVESWMTESDLRRQLTSGRFATLDELIERASERPSIEFGLPGRTRGSEYLEEVRHSRGR
jgi:quinol monooxygenase YgiN